MADENNQNNGQNPSIPCHHPDQIADWREDDTVQMHIPDRWWWHLFHVPMRKRLENEVKIGMTVSPTTGIEIGAMVPPPPGSEGAPEQPIPDLDTYWLVEMDAMKQSAVLPEHFGNPREVDRNLTEPLESRHLPGYKVFTPCNCRIRFVTGTRCMVYFGATNGDIVDAEPIPTQAGDDHWGIQIIPNRRGRICPRAWLRCQEDPNRGIHGCWNIYTTQPEWRWISQLAQWFLPNGTSELYLKNLKILPGLCPKCAGLPMDPTTRIITWPFTVLDEPNVETPFLYIAPNSDYPQWYYRTNDAFPAWLHPAGRMFLVDPPSMPFDEIA